VSSYKIEYTVAYKQTFATDASSLEEAMAQFKAKPDMAHIFAATNQQSTEVAIEVSGIVDEQHSIKILPDGRIIAL
jgi:hypothetical protein